jgi:hypothetical protein
MVTLDFQRGEAKNLPDFSAHGCYLRGCGGRSCWLWAARTRQVVEGRMLCLHFKQSFAKMRHSLGELWPGAEYRRWVPHTCQRLVILLLLSLLPTNFCRASRHVPVYSARGRQDYLFTRGDRSGLGEYRGQEDVSEVFAELGRIGGGRLRRSTAKFQHLVLGKAACVDAIVSGAPAF